MHFVKVLAVHADRSGRATQGIILRSIDLRDGVFESR